MQDVLTDAMADTSVESVSSAAAVPSPASAQVASLNY